MHMLSTIKYGEYGGGNSLVAATPANRRAARATGARNRARARARRGR
jgi:hypothetical protein